jgi:Flp pilus assembly protein TadG
MVERRRRRDGDVSVTNRRGGVSQREREGGATLVVLTLLLVVLMGFAAFGVDAAAALSQRRQNQGTVDTGALSGLQETTRQLKNQARTKVETEVLRITYASLEPDMTQAQWAAEWATCTDPGKPAGFSINAPNTPCISFTSNLQRVRVRLPDIPVETGFGQVLGRDFISTSAHVEAGINSGGGGVVLPFGVPGSASGDPQLCLRLGDYPAALDPCNGPPTNLVTNLNVTYFGNLTKGTATKCSGDTLERYERNIADGLDHEVAAAENSGAAPWLDQTLCSDGNFASMPYTMRTWSNSYTLEKRYSLDDGLIDGTAGVPGRIQRGTNLRTISDEAVDDTPLWSYLNADGLAFCGGVPANHDEMIMCLASWSTGDPILFTPAIADAVRLAWLPFFWDAVLGDHDTNHNIREFRPVWIQTTAWHCDVAACEVIHDPDEPLGGTTGGVGGSSDVQAVTFIQLPFGTLPEEIVDIPPGALGSLSYEILE